MNEIVSKRHCITIFDRKKKVGKLTFQDSNIDGDHPIRIRSS
jgi:hypothetical protein